MAFMDADVNLTQGLWRPLHVRRLFGVFAK